CIHVSAVATAAPDIFVASVQLLPVIPAPLTFEHDKPTQSRALHGRLPPQVIARRGASPACSGFICSAALVSLTATAGTFAPFCSNPKGWHCLPFWQPPARAGRSAAIR